MANLNSNFGQNVQPAHLFKSLFLQFFPIFPLCLFVLLSVGSSLQESTTYDEPSHMASGFRYWRTGQYALDTLHPPLIRLWVTFPLLFEPLELPAPPRKGQPRGMATFADNWLYHNRIPPDTLLNIARFMVVVLGVFLGYWVWRWTHEIFGRAAANVAVTTYSFCPMLLAYTHLATTDMGPPVFSTLALYLFWKFWNSPTRLRAIGTGIGLGLAISAKFSEVLLLPIFFAVVMFIILSDKSQASRLTVDFFLRAAYLLLTAGMILLAFYRVSQWQKMAAGIWEVGSGLRNLHPHFFLGHYHQGAWRWFLAATFLLKTPLPFLFFVVVGVALAALRCFPQRALAIALFLAPCAVYLAFASMNPMQFGIRRILLLYPLLCIWIGGTVAELWKSGRPWQFACAILGLWYVGAALAAFPNYLSYFNETVGGSSQGYKILLDCNLDWGQGFKALSRYLKEKEIHKIYLCPFGCIDPHVYGIQYVPLAANTTVELPGDRTDMRTEKTALFVISATNRGGLYYRDHGLFNWLHSRRPLTVLMNSLWVYDVTHDPEAHRHFADLLRQDGRPDMARRELAWAAS